MKKVLKQMFRDGMEFCIPEGNTQTLEELLEKPFDAIYMIRKQAERKRGKE